jgi:hypothetical protein
MRLMLGWLVQIRKPALSINVPVEFWRAGFPYFKLNNAACCALATSSSLMSLSSTKLVPSPD